MENDDKKIALFERVNGFTGPLSRTAWHWRTRVIARLLANYMFLKNKGERKDSVGAIAEEWRQMFGLNRFWKIDRIDDDTAYCEIHFPCSLERTGDVQACYRLMEYDRALVEKIGGQLVVLESRADPKVAGSCKVAIRKRDDLRTDLIPAHLIE
ncbi:hypothetical protein [Pseudomonas sp. 2FE]|uniref:hypothetical protein n=1 Tax=Pseudomonas sp. 2FE TaxID=2502190 RepID=UPI0010F7CDE0|nr:hypothetical protein [Pseudomonas sp. 2FE]